VFVLLFDWFEYEPYEFEFDCDPYEPEDEPYEL
jgi:hypothetical protein